MEGERERERGIYSRNTVCGGADRTEEKTFPVRMKRSADMYPKIEVYVSCRSVVRRVDCSACPSRSRSTRWWRCAIPNQMGDIRATNSDTPAVYIPPLSLMGDDGQARTVYKLGMRMERNTSSSDSGANTTFRKMTKAS